MIVAKLVLVTKMHPSVESIVVAVLRFCEAEARHATQDK
jgi:hypothetical protein